jgi:hypothetical protein
VGTFSGCETVENVKSKDEYGILQIIEYASTGIRRLAFRALKLPVLYRIVAMPHSR